MEINIGNSYMDVQTSLIVKMSENFTLLTTDETFDLNVNITADFKDIPEEYHEIFLNMLTSKYMNKVSYGHNSFSRCNPPKPKRWWQFWKKK